MNARVILNEPDLIYTSNDALSGEVVLYCPGATTVSSIVVRLVGQSRSFQIRASGIGALKGRVEESHELVHRSQDLLAGHKISGKAGRMPLTFGYHAFPFAFEIPFSNSCAEASTKPRKFADAFVESKQTSAVHVSSLLPPSMKSDGAEITYKIEVTVTTTSVFRQTLKALAAIKFSPRGLLDTDVYEDWRQPGTLYSPSEVDAIRSHEHSTSFPTTSSQMNEYPNEKQTHRASLQPHIPLQPSIPCRSSIPLKFSLIRSAEMRGPLVLQNLQLTIVGTTYTRTQGVVKESLDYWVIQSLSNLSVALGRSEDHQFSATVEIDDRLWRNKPLPENVVPTFFTCNVARTYELELRVGIGYGTTEPRQSFSDLRMPVIVHSRSPSEPGLQVVANVGCLREGVTRPPEYHAYPPTPACSPIGYEGPPPPYEEA